MKKLMLAIALVSFTAFSFGAVKTKTAPVAKQQTTQNAKSTAPSSKKAKKVTKKAVKHHAKKVHAAAKTASEKK